ncbi:MAG: MBL fold metallo-hydrolase [Clostridia bacterium]|nr:MBL fold metallo-hydrolase [Clostridia bacterium]
MIETIASGIRMLSVLDTDIDLFEGQYPVPRGVSYNTYLIEDGKTVLLDTVDARKQDEWMALLRQALHGGQVDMLVISHMEPDHAGSIRALVEAYPSVELVGNAKTFAMLDQFAREPLNVRRRVVAEGDVLAIGGHMLRFVMAPMVHWPEVMVCCEETQKVLFSADAFGCFGEPEDTPCWEDEARRYYANIVGKYGAQVQTLLKKASALDIAVICPLHGPALRGEKMDRALELYGLWSRYTPQEHGVLVAYAGFHGHTAEAAKLLADELNARGEKTALIDLARVHKSYAVGEAFRYDRAVLAAATYDGGYAPAMEAFLLSLKAKLWQNRDVALLENGTWAPMSAKFMRQALEGMKNIRVRDGQVTIRSAMSEQNRQELAALADALASDK